MSTKDTFSDNGFPEVGESETMSEALQIEPYFGRKLVINLPSIGYLLAQVVSSYCGIMHVIVGFLSVPSNVHKAEEILPILIKFLIFHRI